MDLNSFVLYGSILNYWHMSFFKCLIDVEFVISVSRLWPSLKIFTFRFGARVYGKFTIYYSGIFYDYFTVVAML